MIGSKTNKQAIVWRIEGLKNPVPELVMLVNPENLDLTYTPQINETRTLGGFVQEFWGEQLTQLSASGRTAMFYDNTGITNENIRSSESYQNLMSLWNIYKNNGKDYVTVTSQVRNQNKIVSFGTVTMVYFSKQYEGFFDSFNIKEAAEKPFTFEYDLSFKITKTIGDFIVKDGNFTKDK